MSDKNSDASLFSHLIVLSDPRIDRKKRHDLIDILIIAICAAKRHDVPLIKHLTIDEIQAILNAPDTSKRWGIRDRAMLHVCYVGGLRVSELIELPIQNVALQKMVSINVVGKGRRERCLPLWKETAMFAFTCLELGKSFGVSPALRTPVSGGIYSYISHPMYFSHIIVEAGILIACPTKLNFVVAGIAWALYAVRAMWEKKLIMSIYSGTATVGA